ncbi:hypothetical protein [Alicyclobacillus acidoterrestris]|uniref:Uncharacterized protein n=1 Tax=Alicyclobacillus acidoterrestris (strain ATCC 49025 / DSM 3922 / CIP 106132 / NCIMB 13137 / GD3B) TaxID=1356854 RepID=T0BUA8_ALIAG|nr:hypothetical protein [Alicyclobacillus acidoterrestris]EPZ47673.1 hypothetical protein N007_05305 [Alicyclobacillus acidoterrestris ATCC 49025]UNO48009.1 hypothetical protein K1I37_15145 [Alicyclobacillus acidoterrestris]
MEPVKLSKYPVTTIVGEYYVDLEDKYVTARLYNLVARVYVKRNSRFLKWKLVYRTHTGWDKRNEWTGRYVEFAKLAVRGYEQMMVNQLRSQQAHNDGITQFERWDGVVE